MAKFEIRYSWSTEHSKCGVLKIRKSEVVEEMELDSEDAKDWEEHVHSYLENLDQEEIEDRLIESSDDPDGDQNNFCLDSVQKL